MGLSSSLTSSNSILECSILKYSPSLTVKKTILIGSNSSLISNLAFSKDFSSRSLVLTNSNGFNLSTSLVILLYRP